MPHWNNFLTIIFATFIFQQPMEFFVKCSTRQFSNHTSNQWDPMHNQLICDLRYLQTYGESEEFAGRKLDSAAVKKSENPIFFNITEQTMKKINDSRAKHELTVAGLTGDGSPEFIDLGNDETFDDRREFDLDQRTICHFYPENNTRICNEGKDENRRAMNPMTLTRQGQDRRSNGTVMERLSDDGAHREHLVLDRTDDGWATNACMRNRRIVGGWYTDRIEQVPFIVFIDTGCGGSIIHRRWVLTAAHCMDESEPEYVHAGSVHLLGGCQYSVVDSHPHPKFSRKALQFDIGLLKVRPSFKYSPAVKPIPLSKQAAGYGMCGLVTGWGTERYQGMPSMTLKVTFIPVVSVAKCWMFKLKKQQFCAGYKDGRSDSCQGDSGGPFVVEGRIIGIVSFGYRCGEPKFPAVYVDVFRHLRWIRRTMRRNS